MHLPGDTSISTTEFIKTFFLTFQFLSFDIPEYFYHFCVKLGVWEHLGGL